MRINEKQISRLNQDTLTLAVVDSIRVLFRADKEFKAVSKLYCTLRCICEALIDDNHEIIES